MMSLGSASRECSAASKAWPAGKPFVSVAPPRSLTTTWNLDGPLECARTRPTPLHTQCEREICSSALRLSGASWPPPKSFNTSARALSISPRRLSRPVRSSARVSIQSTTESAIPVRLLMTFSQIKAMLCRMKAATSAPTTSSLEHVTRTLGGVADKSGLNFTHGDATSKSLFTHMPKLGTNCFCQVVTRTSMFAKIALLNVGNLPRTKGGFSRIAWASTEGHGGGGSSRANDARALFKRHCAALLAASMHNTCN
mmetsp:Transcript_108186/g.304795  ORF Transcript_108186/g.304795 Transcript_108186/m.304795 type:complete len:255 (+) Transcript_108186:1223-1987(+)